MFAVGVYEMSEALLTSLDETYYPLRSEDVLVDGWLTPFVELRNRLREGEILEYAARDRFEQLVQALHEEAWLDSDYTWQEFLDDVLPEFGVDLEPTGWHMWVDTWEGMEGHQDGDEVHPFNLIARSKATFIAVYYWYQSGHLFVIRSPRVVGGTPVSVGVPEQLARHSVADPRRGEGGVPTYAVPLDVIDGVVAYEEEQGLREEFEESEEGDEDDEEAPW